MSEEEKNLIKKYHDPWISEISEIRPRCEDKDEQFKAIKITVSESDLSKFSLVAHVDDGFHPLENIQGLEKAVCQALNHAFEYLKPLDAWEGEEIITV